MLFSRYSGAVLAGQGSNPVTNLYGYPGQLSLVGNDPADEGCFLWRTDQSLLRRAEWRPSTSLFEFACDVADLYHQQRTLSLPELPGTALEVIWLELAADDSLLVFLKPIPDPESGFSSL